MNATREQFSAFDSADYINSLEDAAAYLEATLEDGDSSDVPRVLGAIARSGNISELSRKVSHALGLQIHFEVTG